MGTRHLYIVRHGQYERQTGFPDTPDGPLTELGRVQAGRIAERLAGVPVTAVYASTLLRAQQTAKIIVEQLPGVPLDFDPLLCECVPSVPADHAHHFAGLPTTWLTDGPALADAAYDKFVVGSEDDRYEVLVSSGNLISFLACRVIEAPRDQWINVDMQHCALTEIHIGPPRGRWLVRQNDAGHLGYGEHTYV